MYVHIKSISEWQTHLIDENFEITLQKLVVSTFVPTNSLTTYPIVEAVVSLDFLDFVAVNTTVNCIKLHDLQ